MKKLLSIMLVVILAFSIVACEDKNENDELVKIAERAIEVTDDYLDANITSDEAEDKLKILVDRAEIETHKHEGDYIHTHCYLIESYISDIYYDIQSSDTSSLNKTEEIITTKDKLNTKLESYKDILKNQN